MLYFFSHHIARAPDFCGTRTMDGDDDFSSEWKSIQVRRIKYLLKKAYIDKGPNSQNY